MPVANCGVGAFTIHLTSELRPHALAVAAAAASDWLVHKFPNLYSVGCIVIWSQLSPSSLVGQPYRRLTDMSQMTVWSRKGVCYIRIRSEAPFQLNFNSEAI